jgi:hypothetical protein
MFNEDFSRRVLPFDSPAARAYAEIAVARRRAGMPISHFDAQIAAIARAAKAVVATRNVADFDGCGSRSSIPGGDRRAHAVCGLAVRYGSGHSKLPATIQVVAC